LLRSFSTVDKRGSIRLGSARYLMPKSLVGECVEVVAHEEKVVIRHAGAEVVRHDPVGSGEVAGLDIHAIRKNDNCGNQRMVLSPDGLRD
jgi:hypothetical protein